VLDSGGMATCIVSYLDTEGLRHTVEVEAESLFEAAALAVRIFKQHDCEPGALSQLEVEIRSSITHTVIPYDTLLRTFELKFSRIHVLHTSLPQANASLEYLLRAIENADRDYQGYTLSDGVIDQWTSLEDEYIRISIDSTLPNGQVSIAEMPPPTDMKPWSKPGLSVL
jgi:hypothetical protein